MPTAQLRIYTIRDGMMEEFVKLFTAEVVPARKAHGFSVIGPWITRDTAEFAWIARYEGEFAWDDGVAAYYESDERRSMSFDPMDYIEVIDTRMLSGV